MHLWAEQDKVLLSISNCPLDESHPFSPVHWQNPRKMKSTMSTSQKVSSYAHTRVPATQTDCFKVIDSVVCYTDELLDVVTL